MGQTLVLLVVSMLIVALVYGLYLAITLTRRRSVQRRQDRRLRELAKVAPEVVSGSPLIDVVTSQGRQLQQAESILRGINGDEVYVFLPTEHATRVAEWLNNRQKERDAR